ncbi:hypothetical protein HPB50_000086 [Hyalomma asiaticum]|uniref:Uncharacterized protein n=1 Tax=Hyalomma asiaticum TaxID=266040 RepID=A0ACB7RXF5_HYAAI|nr:hypothetical protein HPB50_000086 [Hyalomma asiaticum]
MPPCKYLQWKREIWAVRRRYREAPLFRCWGALSDTAALVLGFIRGPDPGSRARLHYRSSSLASVFARLTFTLAQLSICSMIRIGIPSQPLRYVVVERLQDVRLPFGAYVLQPSDLRPAFDLAKAAPTSLMRRAVKVTGPALARELPVNGGASSRQEEAGSDTPEARFLEESFRTALSRRTSLAAAVPAHQTQIERP